MMTRMLGLALAVCVAAAHASERAARRPFGPQLARDPRGGNHPRRELLGVVARLSAFSKHRTGTGEQKIQRIFRILATL